MDAFSYGFLPSMNLTLLAVAGRIKHADSNSSARGQIVAVSLSIARHSFESNDSAPAVGDVYLYVSIL